MLRAAGTGAEPVASDDENAPRVVADEAEEAIDADEDHPFKRKKRKKENTGNVEVRRRGSARTQRGAAEGNH